MANHKKILSIDIDYFSDMLSGSQPTNSCWEIEYAVQQRANGHVDSKLNLIVYNKMYNKVQQLIESGAILYMALSHRDILELVDTTQKHSVIIHNIDYHHDVFSEGIIDINEATCASWGTYLIEEDILQEYRWCPTPLSDTDSPTYEIDYIEFEEILSNSYDSVFVCLSPQWFPPNLQHYFEQIMNLPHQWVGAPYLPGTYNSCSVENIDKFNYCQRVEGGYKFINDPYLDYFQVIVPDDLEKITFDIKATTYGRGNMQPNLVVGEERAGSGYQPPALEACSFD